MGPTIGQIENELATLNGRREKLQQDALPHLLAWVRNEVDQCRDPEEGYTRDSVVRGSQEMDSRLFDVLCQVLEVDCSGLARLANADLRRFHPGVPSLVMFSPINMGKESVRLMYRY